MTDPKKTAGEIYSEAYLSFHDPYLQEIARRAWHDGNMFMLRRVFEREGKNLDEIIESAIQECL